MESTNDRPLERGIALFNAGRFWEAHEAWEAVWKAAKEVDPDLAAFSQGLIWCAAAWVKRRAGEPKGAALHAERVAGRMGELRASRGPVYHGLEFDDILDLANQAADGGPAAAGNPRMRPIRAQGES